MKTVGKGTNRASAAARTAKHAQRTPLPPRPGRIADARDAIAETSDLPRDTCGPEMTSPEARSDDRSERKAAAFAMYAETSGWTTEVSRETGSAEVVAIRGIETIRQMWVDGVWQYEGSTYASADRVTKPRNASHAKKLAERTPEVAAAELAKVGSNQAFRRRAEIPKTRSKIPFDPGTALDPEVITALAGKPVRWINRLSGTEESATVGIDERNIRIVQHDGERVVMFCCPESGYRAFRLSALLKVGTTQPIRIRKRGTARSHLGNAA